jgi:osmotically-inducible protein OsmY
MIDPRDNSDFHDDFDDFDDEDFIEEEHLPPEMGRVHSDDELEKVVKDLLHNGHKIDARDITVTVHNGNVKLSGVVRSQMQRDYAISLTKLVHGVGEVESDLIVKINEGILPTDIGRNP